MTYARWRQDGFDARFVASELAKKVTPLEGGGLRYSGAMFFGEPMVLLETGVEFLVPVSDPDRSRIIRIALEAALRSDDYGPGVLIGKINEVVRDFAGSRETGYVVTTGLSFGHFADITRVGGPGTRLYIRDQFPRHLIEARREAKLRSNKVIRGEYPDKTPFKRYAAAWIHVRGHSLTEAMDRAIEAIDLRRGVWNFALNRGTGATLPPPERGPINEVLAGPLFSLHRRDGSLAAEYDWYDPEYSGPRLSSKAPRKWAQVEQDEAGIRVALKRSPYQSALEDALRRYCRALDSVDLTRSFLELWGLLETLTGIGIGDGYDTLVKRASFIFAEQERETHEQVLYHLRRHRNTYVHAGGGSGETGAYLHQVRRYAEHLLLFHLRTAGRFPSLKAVTHFLDLPAEASGLRHLIETQQIAARNASDTARLAERGLRFREGKQQ